MTSSPSLLSRICGAIAVVFAIVLVAALVLMFASVGIQVVARSLFNTSVLWLDDILMSCFTIAIFTGIALAFRKRAHLSTTVIADSLPENAARIVVRLIDLVSILAMAGLAWIGIDFARGAFGQFTPVLRLPLGWVYLVIPVSAVISILFILETQLSDRDANT